MADHQDAKPPSRKTLVSVYAKGHLLGALFGRYSRSWGREAKIVEAIASAHNDGAIDLLSIITNESLESVKKHEFFAGQNLYCKLIPHLDAQTKDMVHAVDCLIRAAGNDLAGGLPSNALAEWCQQDQARAGQLLELVNAGDTVAQSFIPLAVGNAEAEVRRDLIGHLNGKANMADDASRHNAVFRLGQIEPRDDSEWEMLLQTLASAALSGDDLVRGASIAAATRRLRESPANNLERLEEVISKALEGDCGERTLHQCADSLWLDGEHLSASLRGRMLGAMLGVNPVNLGTIDHLDNALAHFVRSGNANEVSAFLAEFLVRHDGNIKLEAFDTTCHSVHEQAPSVLHDWLVDWLLDGRFDLCSGLAGGLFQGQLNERVLDIDFAKYALKPADFSYLARKAIGYLFLQPLTVASIILSLARSAPKPVQQELEDLLFDPMLLNYGGFAKELLEPVSKRKGDRAKGVAKRALLRIKSYIKDLSAAGDIPELEPSERQRQMEWQRHTDSMAEAYRLADQKSIFADIVTKVVVLYGNRSVSYVRHPKEETRRIETKMHSHGVSFEMPRIEIVDPVGLQKMILTFRSERRPT